MRAERSAEAAPRTLAEVRRVAEGDGNLLPPMREALRRACTVGEICNELRDVFGMYDAQQRTSLVRILLVSQMYPGPDDPDLGRSSRAWSARSPPAVHELERVVTEGRGGGKRRHLSLAREVGRAARSFGRTSSTRTSSSPPGSRPSSSAARLPS